MSGLVTSITKINATAEGIADTEVNPVNVVGASRTITVTTIGGGSLDSALFRLPDGANRINWTPGTEPEAGSVGELLELLLAAKVLLGGTAKQVIVTADENGDLTLSLPQAIATDSNVQFQDLTLRRLAGSGSPPGVTYGNGAGGDGVPASSSVVGKAGFFTLTLTTGAAPTGTFAPIATFAFAPAYAAAPLVLVIPANRKTWALHASETTACSVQTTTDAGFTFNAGSSGLAAGGAPYSWHFVILGA